MYEYTLLYTPLSPWEVVCTTGWRLQCMYGYTLLYTPLSPWEVVRTTGRRLQCIYQYTLMYTPPLLPGNINDLYI